MKRIAQSQMNIAPAVLGVGEVTTYNEVIRAWRRCLKHAHPDTGGSGGRARGINEAKDLLIAYLSDYPCELRDYTSHNWWERRFGRLREDEK